MEYKIGFSRTSMTTTGVASVRTTKEGKDVSIDRLAQALEPKWEITFHNLLFNRGPRLIHLLGVGNPMRRDDGVGLYVIKLLKKTLAKESSAVVKVHRPTVEPERLISELATARETFLIVDAVQTGADPGTIVCAPLADTKFGYFATHNIPLRLIPGVVESTDSAFVLGIEPRSVEFGEGLSPEVVAAADRMVRRLNSMIEGERIGEL